jgi:hypothetical protein
MNNIRDYLKEQETNIKNNGTEKFKIRLLIIITFLFIFSMFGFLHITHEIFNGFFGSDTITVSKKQLRQLIIKQRQELKELNKYKAINSKFTEELKKISRNNTR